MAGHKRFTLATDQATSAIHAVLDNAANANTTCLLGQYLPEGIDI